MWYSFTLIVLGSTYLTIANKWTLPDTRATCLSLVVIGVCGIFDQYLITLAFQYEKAGPISVVRTFNIVLSFLWEVLLLNEQIQFTSVLGACLICSCVIVLALVKWNKESPETFDRIRRKFCCFCPAPGPSKKGKKRSLKASKKAKINGKDIESNLAVSKELGLSTESIESIDHVQNTVNSNAILLIKSDEEDNDEETDCRRK